MLVVDDFDGRAVAELHNLGVLGAVVGDLDNVVGVKVSLQLARPRVLVPKLFVLVLAEPPQHGGLARHCVVFADFP